MWSTVGDRQRHHRDSEFGGNGRCDAARCAHALSVDAIATAACRELHIPGTKRAIT